MRKLLLATCLGAVATFAVSAANANDALDKMSQDPKGWVMPAGD
ncbi:MAG: lanthanide-dependent methanol dehydrogenase, partial [Bradyrhizobium sp.]|nr:lanthanide-dependent methanol dehydrogenase [Bradyrhizobium sp.]